MKERQLYKEKESNTVFEKENQVLSLYYLQLEGGYTNKSHYYYRNIATNEIKIFSEKEEKEKLIKI